MRQEREQALKIIGRGVSARECIGRSRPYFAVLEQSEKASLRGLRRRRTPQRSLVIGERPLGIGEQHAIGVAEQREHSRASLLLPV